MYVIKKSRQIKSVKIYVNGSVLPYSWNGFSGRDEALRYIENNSIVGCNPLLDHVQIKEEIVDAFDVVYQGI